MSDHPDADAGAVVLGTARVITAPGPPQVLVVSGELDLTNAEGFGVVLREVDRPVVLDLGGLTYFDSSALRIVITEHLVRPLSIVAPQGCIARRVIEVTGALGDAVRDA